tara:strand:- start:489 stop:809 length:321 start_codon:yes stop_codon:yes gene_type:complete
MSVQTKELIERWSVHPFSEIAIAEACIGYYEYCIEGWKETLRQEVDFDDEEDENEYDILVSRSSGMWSRVSYENYVSKDDFRKAVIRDLDTMMRYYKFADDLEEEE